MPTVLIDANVLLGFWSCRSGRVPSNLLLPLVELRDHVLVTQQIVDEVQRRKLGVFLESRGKFSHELPPDLPDHLTKVRSHAEASANLLTLDTALKEGKKAWDVACEEIAGAISRNEDLTSVMLAPLFAQAVEANNDQLCKARERRERGNPPGKRSDPLGDQVTWQQFVDAAAGSERAWIVTRDSDYFHAVGGHKLLNSALHEELTKAGVRNIELHETLAKALKSMRDAGLGIGADLDEAALDRAGKEEEAFRPHPPHPMWPDADWRCPRCDSVNAGTDLVPRPSQYGGWSYWTGCRRCGFTFDTGEPYDE